MSADLGGYLNGAIIDKETSLFRGAGNLPALVQNESCFFFLGVSIVEEGSALIFGDQANENLIFLAAIYQPIDNESLSQLIFLDKAVFEAWLLHEDGNPPNSDDWHLLSFNDWKVTNHAIDSNRRETSFENLASFQTGCAIFIQYCLNLKATNDPLSNQLLKLSQVDDEGSSSDDSEKDENEGDTSNDEGVEKDDGLDMPRPKTTVKKTRKDPNEKGQRSSDRVLIRRMNINDDPLVADNAAATDNGGFKIRQRGRKPAGGSKNKKKAASAAKTNNGAKGGNQKKQLDPPLTLNNKRPRGAKLDSGVVDDNYHHDSLPPRTPGVPPRTPGVVEEPRSAEESFDLVMSQQYKVLGYQEKVAGFLFGAAERYSMHRYVSFSIILVFIIILNFWCYA